MFRFDSVQGEMIRFTARKPNQTESFLARFGSFGLEIGQTESYRSKSIGYGDSVYSVYSVCDSVYSIRFAPLHIRARKPNGIDTMQRKEQR